MALKNTAIKLADEFCYSISQHGGIKVNNLKPIMQNNSETRCVAFTNYEANRDSKANSCKLLMWAECFILFRSKRDIKL